jgi:hypothetical protein
MRGVLMLDAIGWAATAIFTASYFVRPAALRWIQALAACMWIAYGVAIGARPVIIANIIVTIAAVYSVLKPKGARERSSDTTDLALPGRP